MKRKFGKNEKEGPPRHPYLLRLLEQGVREKMEIPLMDTFVKAWGKGVEVAKAIEESRSSKDAVGYVSLYEHEIKSTVHPEIEIEFMGTRYSTIRLDFEMSAVLHGAKLEIKGGRICAVEIGDISFRLRLLYEDVDLLPAWESQAVKVGDKISLSQAA